MTVLLNFGRVRRLCVFGGLCVDMWRLVHQWSFLLFWLSFDCFWRLVQCTNLQKQIGVPIVTGLSRLYQQCTNSQKQSKDSQTAKMTIGVPIVTCLPRLYQQCTNRQKQSKDSQNSKNDPWCTNRHMSTKTVPTVYQSSKTIQNSKKTVKRQSKQQKWPLVYQSSHVYTESAEYTTTASTEYTKPVRKRHSDACMRSGGGHFEHML